ncbi:MAG: RidA family protein [Rhodothermaceae bacterium]|nr:RidA family protein [Rhodothermaceae bacterium]
MSRKTITATDAPKALGPYSQAVVHNNIVYCSGQIGLDPASGEFAGSSISTQTRQVMLNLKAVLTRAGSSFDQVLKCSIFLVDMNDFSVVNQIYGEHFGSNPPARETVAVKTLPKSALVEISCVAATG